MECLFFMIVKRWYSRLLTLPYYSSYFRVELVEKKRYISPSTVYHFAGHFGGSVELFVVLKILSKMTSEMIENAWANIGFFSTTSTRKYEE